jgi:hypothetical protein
MHTNQEWNILTFDLICNSKFDTLKLVLNKTFDENMVK